MAYVLYDANNNITDIQTYAPFSRQINAAGYMVAGPTLYVYISDFDPTVLAWLATNNKTITFLQFMTLFTPTEQAALATSVDPTTRVFVMQATGSGGMQLSNTMVQQGVGYVASIGIIANTRITEILSGTQPAANT